MLHFMPVYIMKCLTYPEIYGNLVYPQKALICTFKILFLYLEA